MIEYIEDFIVRICNSIIGNIKLRRLKKRRPPKGKIININNW